MFRGFGTVLNVTAVLLGSGIGLLVGTRFPARTRDVVTDGLGLVTLLVAALNTAAVLDPAYEDVVGASATLLVVLGAVLIGGIIGSLLRIEHRLEQLGGALQRRLGRTRIGSGVAGPAGSAAAADDGAARRRFIEGFVSASLLFCVGPLTILGSLSDGLGEGYEQLALKAVLDGFASIAFAASLGWGVMASALTVLVVQGSLTVIGALLGDLLPDGHIAALTATGGLLLVGVALRLLRIKQLPVGDLLPALLVAPVLTQLVGALR
jgi:uncharacterized protein